MSTGDDAVDTSEAFFEGMYRSSSDPWNFRRSRYERERYAAIIGACTRERYGHAYEPGCSIGELTVLLAPLCQHLFAHDHSARAVEIARTRCLELPQAHITKASIETFVPPQPLDLIVMAEVGYYFTPPRLLEILSRWRGDMANGAQLVACHWLGSSHDHHLHGAHVHELIRAVFGVPARTCSRSDDGYLLQRWELP